MSARALAAAAALLAAACAPNTYRRPGAPLPAFAPRAAAVRLLVFGDFGDPTPHQREVAVEIAREPPFDLAVQLGDNVYPCGPDPLGPAPAACRFADDGSTIAAGTPAQDDPVFARNNERPLSQVRDVTGAPLASFLALGNHDLGWSHCSTRGLSRDEALRRRACVSVAHASPTWRMPGRHYIVDRGPVRLIVVDTDVLIEEYGGFTLESEIAFVRDAAAGCEGRFCFLAGHHPPASAGGRTSPAFQERMARLLAAGGSRISAFLAGHQHALEHLTLDGLDVIVAGRTARGGPVSFDVRAPDRAELLFGTEAFGYAVLEADADGWWLRFSGVAGDNLYCCATEGRGPCRPVACPPRARKGAPRPAAPVAARP